MDDIGWFTFAMAGIGAALMAIPASLAVRRAGAPGWLCWTGVVLGVASLGTVGFFGLFAWLAWIAGAAIVMIARSPLVASHRCARTRPPRPGVRVLCYWHWQQ